MDDGDYAKAWQERQIEIALGLRVKPSTMASAQRYCERCGEEIPERRRLAAPGCLLCVECQRVMERR